MQVLGSTSCSKIFLFSLFKNCLQAFSLPQENTVPEQCSNEIAAVLCQGSGGVYKRVSAADEAVVPAAEAESCRCRSGPGKPCLSCPRCTWKWAVLTFIAVIKIMPALAAAWAIRCKAVWTLVLLLTTSKGQQLQQVLLNQLWLVSEGTGRLQFITSVQHCSPCLTVGIAARSDRC